MLPAVKPQYASEERVCTTVTEDKSVCSSERLDGGVKSCEVFHMLCASCSLYVKIVQMGIAAHTFGLLEDIHGVRLCESDKRLCEKMFLKKASFHATNWAWLLGRQFQKVRIKVRHNPLYIQAVRIQI